MHLSLWAKVNLFPPIVCRLLARCKKDTGGIRPMTADEIARATGFTVAEVNSLSWLTSWDEVPYAKIQAFMEGCGIDLTSRDNLRMHSKYMRRAAPFKYLKKSPQFLSLYQPLILAYIAHVGRR